MAARILCPQCACIFTSDLRSVVGTQLTCPRCQKSFQARAQDVKSPAAPNPPGKVGKPAPPPPGFRRPPTTKPNPPTATPPVQSPTAPVAPKRTKVILLASAVLVLVAALIAIPLLLSNDPKETEVAGNNPKPDPKTGSTKPDPKPGSAKTSPHTGSLPPTSSTSPGPSKSSKPSMPPPPPVSPELQAKIDRAIIKGVTFLKCIRFRVSGTRFVDPRAGFYALRGLTLLECGVPSSDPMIEEAAKELRAMCPTMNQTYDIALTILFLDRLGEYQDRRRIESLSLRLLAAQRASGGWDYNCTSLAPENEEQFYAAIREGQPQNPLDMLELDQQDEQKLKPLLQNQVKKGEMVQRLHPTLPTPSPQEKAKLPKDLIPLYEKELPVGGKAKLPAELQNAPSLLPVPKQSAMLAGDHTDNSNTQFAILGLWTARRYGVPMDRAMALIVKRFRKSQNGDGTWGYQYVTGQKEGGTHTMTCAGLLGLAVAHGLVVDALTPKARSTVTIKDPAIARGMSALTRYLEEKEAGAWRVNPLSMYLFWSIERVGVLYGKYKIGKVEWYREGAQLLVDQQHKEGCWTWLPDATYHGSEEFTDTCFALLFLKRANLVQDLTEKLDELLENQ